MNFIRNLLIYKALKGLRHFLTKVSNDTRIHVNRRRMTLRATLGDVPRDNRRNSPSVALALNLNTLVARPLHNYCLDAFRHVSAATTDLQRSKRRCALARSADDYLHAVAVVNDTQTVRSATAGVHVLIGKVSLDVGDRVVQQVQYLFVYALHSRIYSIVRNTLSAFAMISYKRLNVSLLFVTIPLTVL